MDFVDLWRCGRICCLHLIQVLRFRVLGSSFSRFGCFVFDLGCFVFEFWVLRFRDLGASFSSFGCFVFEIQGSSFSSFGCFVFDLGCFVFEIWVLRASVFVFECFVFETTKPRQAYCACCSIRSLVNLYRISMQEDTDQAPNFFPQVIKMGDVIDQTLLDTYGG